MKSVVRALVLIALCAAMTLPAVESLAAGNATQPTICNRACWSARSPTSYTYMSTLNRAVVHHTAGASDYNTTSLSVSAAKVRAIQNMHMDGNGWSDIGYNFLTDKLGNNFEGRYNSMTRFTKGAHDAVNTNSFGFNMLGYYHSPYNNAPTSAGLNAMYRLIAWRIPNPFTGYGAGTYNGKTVGYICGHRDANPSACPGDLLYAYIGTNTSGGAMRNGVNALIVGATPTPTPTPPPTPVPGADPSIVVLPDTRIALFAIGTDTGIWHCEQTSPGSSFSSWSSLGGSGFSQIEAAYLPNDNIMTVYGCGNGTALWQTWELSSGGSWSGWSSLGGSIKQFDIFLDDNDEPAACAVGADTAVYYSEQNGVGSWDSWTSLGGSGFSMAKGYTNYSGAHTVFGCGVGGALLHKWQTSPGSSSWSNWTSLGGTVNDFDIVKNYVGLPTVFAVTGTGSLSHIWQVSEGGSWSSWTSLDGSGFTNIDALVLPTGELAFFGYGAPGVLYTRVQDAPGGYWSSFINVGSSVASVAADVLPNGVQFFIGRGAYNNNMMHSWQTSAGGSWATWISLGCCFK